MYNFFLIIFIIIAVILIVLIMIQQNKGNSIIGGSSALDNRSLMDMLNSRTSDDGITRVIVVLAILFFVFSLLLGNINSKQNQKCTQENSKDLQISRK